MLIRFEITVPKYLAPKEILKKIQVTTRPDNVQQLVDVFADRANS